MGSSVPVSSSSSYPPPSVPPDGPVSQQFTPPHSPSRANNLEKSAHLSKDMENSVGKPPDGNAASSTKKTLCKLVFLRIPAGALSVIAFGGAQAVSFSCSALLCGAFSIPVGLLYPAALCNIDFTVRTYEKAAKLGVRAGHHMSEGAGSLMKYAAESDTTADWQFLRVAVAAAIYHCSQLQQKAFCKKKDPDYSVVWVERKTWQRLTLPCSCA
jgi:hypothetical protein